WNYDNDNFKVLSEADIMISDYSSVILHVFSPESRDFYKLEKLYSEGDEVSIEDILTED
ncbi:MAG: hypothetical protein E7575_05300, partial [Ruminococcaceae bacterium]|nr:hypothetical protein [Oscillospiraceae bacterium]